MKVSKYIMLSIVTCLSLGGAMSAMLTNKEMSAAQLSEAVSYLQAKKLANGKYTVPNQTKSYSSAQLIDMYEDMSSIDMNPTLPPRTGEENLKLIAQKAALPGHKNIPTGRYTTYVVDKISKQPTPSTITSLKKEIAQTHKNMLKLVDQIAGNDLTQKFQLLNNILMHEQQSEASLEEHKAHQHRGIEEKIGHKNIPSKYLRSQDSSQFPGCPACG